MTALPLDTSNVFAVTAHEGEVIVLRKVGRVLSPEVALQLAAWLIVAVEMTGKDDALEVTVATVKAVIAT